MALALSDDVPCVVIAHSYESKDAALLVTLILLTSSHPRLLTSTPPHLHAARATHRVPALRPRTMVLAAHAVATHKRLAGT
jgi:hypothetical protein